MKEILEQMGTATVMKKFSTSLFLCGLLILGHFAAINAESQPAVVCNLPPLTGRCRASHSKFYYNSSERQCLPFVYGGCGGNGNRFNTKEECESACKK
uniref:BPTI/Kunitz inhibitor domain-containing protein n=1 Tax=Romanomermis culicivorax TaxID=13658 RepID=A0A915HUH5_ROMCU